MKRRQFVRNFAVLGGAFALGAPIPLAARRDHDLVIRNGWIIDGTGRDRFVGDVAIDGDRIAAVGRVSARGVREIDASGHVVAPGFIDVHSHAGLSPVTGPRAERRRRQGVTRVGVGRGGGRAGARDAGGRPNNANLAARWSGDRALSLRRSRRRRGTSSPVRACVCVCVCVGGYKRTNTQMRAEEHTCALQSHHEL